MVLKVVALFISVCVALSLQLKVSVYYESLCPDSVSFIKKQLYPTYQKAKNAIELDLVPYGKAIQNKEDGKWVFECQHGPNECYGNKVQACALNQNYTEEVEVNYIYCVMRQRNPARAGERCANEVKGVSWNKISACVNSDLGDNYLAYYGDRTHSLNPSLSFVPTVIFNDTFDDDLMWDSLKNLEKVICKLMGYPSFCSPPEIKKNKRFVRFVG